MGGASSKEATSAEKASAQARYEPPKPVESEDYSKPVPRGKLSPALQDIVDHEEKLWDNVKSGHGSESTDSNVRYAAYASRARTILLSAQRYVAYTSDIGESFRPIAHPYLVKGAYGISWAYLVGDVTHEGYKAYVRQQALLHPQSDRADAAATSALTKSIPTTPAHLPAIEDYRAVMAQRAVFQSIASMGLPAFTIHSIVRYSGRALKDVKNVRIRSWGPIGLGLAAVPFLPYMFDQPVEHAVEWTFHKAFETVGGPAAVGHAPEIGREARIDDHNRKVKEKEL